MLDSTKETVTAKNEIAVSQDTQQLADFKSIFYMFNGKPDTTTKVFTENVKVDFDSIVELNNRLLEKLQMHYIEEGYIASITVSFANRKTISFDCWRSFEQYNWVESSYIKSVVLVWDFAVKLGGYENPQRHKLTVKISDGLKPEEMLNLVLTGKIENMEELDTNHFPIVAQMDFINVQLSEEFINIVSEWVNSLEKARDGKSKVILALRKHRKLFTSLLKYITIFFTYFLGVMILNFKFYSYEIDKVADIQYVQILELLNTSAIVLFSFVVLYKILDKIEDSVLETLLMYNKHHIFNICKGDKNKQSELKELDRKDVWSISLKFIFALIIDIVCAIISSALIESIGIHF